MSKAAKLLFFVASFVAFQARAQNLCREVKCSAGQAALQKAFDDHPVFAPATASAAYSGICYHYWPGIDPERPQFVMSVVEATGLEASAQFTLNSVFDFYSATSPFANLDLGKAKAELVKDGCHGEKLAVSPTQAYAIQRSSEGTIEYWVRSDGQDLYLLGSWNLKTGQVRNWCHMTRNN